MNSEESHMIRQYQGDQQSYVTAPAFGDLLRQHRMAASLTQEELAYMAGVSTRTIGNLERRITSRPQRKLVVAIAEALELSDGDLLRFKDTARGRYTGASLPLDDPFTVPTSRRYR